MSALKQLKSEILSPANVIEDADYDKNQHEIEVAEFQSSDQSVSICGKAFEKYQVGRKAIYEALALTYIWYEVSKDNRAYIDEAFKPFASQTNSHVYSKALKVCLRLDENKQAPTITKYKNVLSFLNKELGNQRIDGDDKGTIDKIVGIIQEEGGIDACAKNASGSSQKPTNDNERSLSKEEVSQLAAGMLAPTLKALGGFKCPKSVKVEDNTLVAGLLRLVDGKLEVMDVTAKGNCINHLLRYMK